MEKSCDVVVWCEENLIDYVPSSWGNDTKTKYKYPTSTNSFKIRKSTPINENFDWLKAVCKAEAVKDLSMAKDLCNRGQYTSNLETADEQTATERKRIRMKTKRIYESNDSTSSEESTDNNEPLSSLIKSKKKTKLNKQTGSYSGGLIRENFYEELGCNNSSFTPTVSSPSVSNLASTSKVASLGTPTGRATPLSLPVRNSLQRIENNDFTTLMSEIYNTKFEIQELRKVVNRIENIVTANAVSNIPNEDTTNNKLPCKTTAAIDDLEAEMASKENFKNLVNSLYLVGGNTPHKTVYFMMNKLFGKQLALKYSGQGKKKKLPFCGLKIYDALLVATRKRHPSSTEDEIKKTVALFLATAKSRLPKDRPDRDNSQDQELDQETD